MSKETNPAPKMSAKKKMSSVEFYRKELNALVSFRETKFKTEQKIFEQAKAMHKEESELLFECGRNFQLKGEGTFNEVYSETFGGNNE